MCLPINRNQKPEIATKPIICYKCLTKNMLSPCFEQKYELGKLMNSEIFIRKLRYCDKIEKGLHTFADEFEAKFAAEKFQWFSQINGFIYKTPVVVKCEIPVGATYYKAKSISEGITFEYASNQLLPLEIIYQ